MTWLRRAGYGIAGVVAGMVLGCSNEGPSGNDGGIEVAISPASLTVARGGSGSVTVTLTREGGFSGAVTLTSTGLPTGITVSVVPAQLSGATVTATVNLTVAASTATGTYTGTVTATAPGADQATATYQVTVTEAADFALTVTPAARTIVAGGSSAATVGISRTSFPNAIALTLLNPPGGITGVFEPASSTTGGSGLTVNVGAGVAPGVYPLTIQGTATGPGSRTTTLTVTVPAPPAGGNVQFQFCSPEELPAFFAFQDGAGAWQAVTGTVSGAGTAYTLNLSQSYGGVLLVYRFADAGAVRSRIRLPAGLGSTAGRIAQVRQSALGDVYFTVVVYGSRTELAQDGAETCAATQPTKTLTAAVAGVPPGSYGRMSLGGVTRIFDGAASTNPLTFEGVPSGLVDLVGTRTIPGAAPNRALVIRNLNLADGAAVPGGVDFAGASAVVPATATATVTGGGGDALEIYVDLVTANGLGGMWADLSPSPTSTRPWGGLGPAAMLSSDMHGLYAFASAQGSPGDFRVVLRYVGPVADQTLALGPTIAAPTSSPVAGGAYPRYRFQGVLPAVYDKGATIDLVGDDLFGNIYSFLATSAWLAAKGNGLAYDFTMPDVAGLPGFPIDARLTAGDNLLIASGFGFTGAGAFDLRPVLGGEFKASIRSGATIVVP